MILGVTMPVVKEVVVRVRVPREIMDRIRRLVKKGVFLSEELFIRAAISYYLDEYKDFLE